MAATADVTRGRLSAAIATALAAAVLIAMGLFLLGAPAADAASTYAHLGTFSGPGSADGEMVAPRRVAVDAAGNVLVVDSGNDRIQVFSPTGGGGSFLTQFGGGGVLNDPYGVAVDRATGAVYVSDAGNSRIVRFTSNGLPVPSYTLDLTYPSPAQGGGTGQVSSFASPIATVPGTGDLVVADTGSQTVKRFNADGSYDGLTFDGADSVEGAFTDLLDLAVDSTGDVIVVHSIDAPGQYPYEMVRGRVSRFSAGGSFEGAVAPPNAFPGAVAVNSVDQVLITDNQFSYTTDNPLNLRLYSPSNELVSTTPLPGESLWSRVHGLATGPGVDGRAYVVTDQVDGVWGLLGRVAVEAFEPVNPIPPDTTVTPASAVTTNSATFNGTVDPNAKATSYHFDYRTGNTGSWTSTPNGDAGDGDTPVAVTADVAGLTPNTTYQFRLVATNPDGTTTSPVDSFTTAKAPPVASTLDASQVTDTSAWLHGEVNPSGEPTKYRFEYGTTTSYGNRLPADGDASAGQGVTTQPVSRPVYDLQPNTTYHFRIVAENATGRVEGADKTFATKTPSGDACPNEAVRAQQGSTRLPDCRAYEQVTPRDKAGYEIGSMNGGIYLAASASPSGDRMSFTPFYPLPGTRGGIAHVLASRGDNGWTSVGVTLKQGPNVGGLGMPGTNFRPRGVNPDQTVFANWDITTEPSPSLWIRRADGTHQVIAYAAAGSSVGDDLGCLSRVVGGCPGQVWFAGMSDDGSRILFTSNQRLGPAVGLPGDEDILYEWVDHPEAGGGELRVVNRTNDASVELLDESGAAALGGTSPHTLARDGGARGARNAISDGSDGHTRVFFQDPAPTTEDAVEGGSVYMREDGEETVELSAPEGANAPSSELRYVDASADGSLVFLWSGSKLTDDPGAGEGIYRYDVAERDLAFLAAAPRIFVGSSGDPYAPPTAMASDDGSRLYYQSGDDVRVNEPGSDRLIIANRNVVSGDKFAIGATIGIRDDHCPSANVSPGSGRYFAFSARRASASPAIYRYDADGGELAVVAESPGTYMAFTALCYGDIVEFPREVQVKVMSDDGRFVFFDTKTALVARDVNDMADTYRWDGRDGGIELVSSGTSAAGTGSVGASPGGVTSLGTDATGTNAFFATSERLAVDDRDGAYDIYSARVGGGFYVEPDPAGCEGDSCQTSGVDGRGRRPVGSAREGRGNASAVVRSSLSVAGLSRAQRRALVAGRRVKLGVRVSRAGRVTVVARARIGGRPVVIARGSTNARSAGLVRVDLRLSNRARKRLKATGRLGAVLSVRFASSQRAMRLDLRRAK